MTDSAASIRERRSAVRDASEKVRTTPLEDRAQWLADGAERLRREAIDQREALAKVTGLSPPMVRWGASTTLDTVQTGPLLSIARDAATAGRPIDMLSVVLAGNLFTSVVRAVVVPLVLGIPVLAKASSREAMFPLMLREALRRADAELGAAFDVVGFPGGDVECETALIDAAGAVAVYGGDESVSGVRTRHARTPVIAHGHGVSVAYCGGRALSPPRIANSIAALSLDICAYDQRGCLSPQIVYVEEAADGGALAFAERLAYEGLAPMETALPRGPLPGEVGAAQAQWRGLAEVESQLIEGERFAIAVTSGRGARWSPGYRNVTVAGVPSIGDALQAVVPLGAGLKCVGADEDSLSSWESHLHRDAALNAYACPLGTMQTPGLDAPADGHPIWHGLVRP